jgi:hypothetical protein
MYDRENNAEYEQRLQRAWRFYSKVLNHSRRQGKGSAKAHQAAIGMPAALKNWRGREHVRNFVAMALADGTPLDDLVLLAEELARETRQAKRL